jgi:glycosyltransferase involved in cell wall biosynthesis
MDYAPNRDAATYLITEIFPLVQSKVAEARLLVVGRDAPPDLVRLGGRPGVQVTGLVPDVRPYLEQASVFVAPIRFGAGIQNKLLEAMAMALPVIASPVAAEGLCAEGGDRPPVTVVASPTECADRIVERLGATRSDPTPDQVGRAFVERHFVWERSAGRIDAIFASLAGQRP